MKFLPGSSSLSRRQLLKVGAATATTLLAPSVMLPASAQEDARLKRAKEKGKVTWYTSMFPTEMREALSQGFEKSTGVRMSIYGAGTNEVVARLRTERATGARNVDVFDGGDYDVIEAMIKDKILKSFRPKGAEAILPDFKDSRGYFYGIYAWALVITYNTTVYTPATAPQGWLDLSNPKFKGKIIISDPARATAALGFCKVMVKWKGWDWIEEFLRNDPLVMSVSSEIQPAVVRNERPIGIISSQFPSKMMEEGAPINIVKTDDPLFPSPDVIGIIADAPNPDGAELFVEYLISKQAQEIVRGFGPYSSRVDVSNPFGMPPLKDVKFKYMIPPPLDIDAVQIAERFQKMLRAAKR